ncbi:MAG: heparinase II/III-family protein [Treponema sp.]|jgi:hypothetical protein|nr:heparinase II/III-family protein [Treponema sp.]
MTEPDAAVLYDGLRYGSAAGAAGSALFKKICGGKTPDAIRNDPFLSSFTGYLKDQNKIFSQQELAVLPFSAFKLFDTRGDRGEFESRYFERRKRLLAQSLSLWLDKTGEDPAPLEDTIWALCDEYSWCLPAHMDGTSLVPAAGNRRTDNTARLDLFACETGFALAECCAMLEDQLSPALISRAREEIRRRVLRSYTERGELWNWELMDNNWCAVCAGSLAGAAMYLIKDDLLLGGILLRLAPVFRRFIGGFYSDGACAEGLSYWTYGMSFYAAFADLLFHRTGGKIDLLQEDGFAAIARFQQYAYFPGGGALNFSDASGGDMFRPGLSSYLASRVEGVSVPSHPFEARVSGGRGIVDPCGRFAPALRDLLWTGKDVPRMPEGPRCDMFPEAQWLLCAGAHETGFAAKGGHNDEPHNHNDVGNFIFYKKGVMVFCDLGAGEYTRDYFSDKRYTVFCNCSESHNVPVINGAGQKAGRDFRARDCRISGAGGIGELSLDMAGAYRIPGLESLKRRFVFDTAEGSLLIEDTFDFSGKPLPVIERFVSLSAPLADEGVVYIDTGSSRSLIRGPEGIGPVIGEVLHRDHGGKDVKVFTIDYPAPPGSGGISLRFNIS